MLVGWKDDLLIIGITERNVELLKERKPIYFDMSSMPSRKIKHFAIMFGVNQADILIQLRDSGCEIPQAIIESVKDKK